VCAVERQCGAVHDDTWLSRTSAWLHSTWGSGLVLGVGSSAVGFLVVGELTHMAAVLAITAAIALVPGVVRSPRAAATLATIAAAGFVAYLAVTYARGLVIALATVLMVVFAGRLASGLGAQGRATVGVVVSAAVVTIVLVAFPAHHSAGRRVTTAASHEQPAAVHTTPPPQPAKRPPPAAKCTRNTASGDEGETADARRNNDQRASATGPLRGAVDVSGAIDSANDRDWAFFCVAPTDAATGTGAQRVIVRLVNSNTAYECSELQAQVKSIGGALIGDALQPSPTSIVSWAHTLRPGGPYGILITDPGGDRCRWVLSVGPPGAFVGDSAVPALPCVPPGEQSARIGAGEEHEPNDRLDQVNFLAADTAERTVAVTGSVGPEDDDWFALCISVREPVQITLRSLDYIEYERCDDLSFELLDSSATSVGSGEDESGPVLALRYTLGTGAPYYVRVATDSGDTTCRYRLRLAPAQHLVDAIPVR